MKLASKALCERSLDMKFITTAKPYSSNLPKPVKVPDQMLNVANVVLKELEISDRQTNVVAAKDIETAIQTNLYCGPYIRSIAL